MSLPSTLDDIQPLRPTSDALDILEPFGCTITIRRTHEIYKQHDPARFCWKILSGCARKVTSMEDGRRQIKEFGWPGDLLGIHDYETHFHDAQAVTDMTLRRYPRQVLEANAQINAALALRLRMMTLSELGIAKRQIVLLGRATAVERIASFLLEMDRLPARTNRKMVELPMNRTDIADHLGLSIETVCRNLVGLQREGIVLILRTGIELLDRRALCDLACEARY